LPKLKSKKTSSGLCAANPPATSNGAHAPGQSYLGIECGATRSAALLVAADKGRSIRAQFGPANLRLMDDAALADHFSAIKAMQQDSADVLRGIVIGMAGMRTDADRKRIIAAAANVWPRIPVYATNDLEPALMAAPSSEGKAAQVLIVSGTGSCCFGRTAAGKTLRYGGWGHILGDKGSGYEIGMRSLKAVVYYYDRDGKISSLGSALLKKLKLNEPEDLIDWAKTAEKPRIAALAVEVFAESAKGSKIARDILAAAAESLAKDGAQCAKRLVKKGTPVEFVLSGGVFQKQPAFVRKVKQRLQQLWPGSSVTTLNQDSVFGCIRLAEIHFSQPRASGSAPDAGPNISERAHRAVVIPTSAAMSPTEQRNARSMKLDELSLIDAVELMISEEAKVTTTLLHDSRLIARGVELIVDSFKRGGRLFYVGAGTSGRLGVLDAAECPPTFRVSQELVQGIIAGGQTAICDAVEGAEDDSRAGGAALDHRGVGPRDIVVGITASGRTPFVWGALTAARRLQARSMLLCFNPNLTIPDDIRPDLVIAAGVGPEVLTGSTRLKAGTATKIVLNIFTTLAMVQMGKVVSNLMVDLNASNAKLRDRAVRIVQDLTGADAVSAQSALEKSKWIVKTACQQLTG
jgi:N-acetylmuramic acid 6-phosphate etherase